MKQKNILRRHFDMKNICEANFILGMKITKTCDGIYLEQSHYIEKILKKYNYHDFKHVVTSLDSSVHLFPVNNDNDVVNQKEYANIIGSLRYAIDCAGPDIAYAVEVLSRFTSKPSGDHMQAIERVMKYLSSTKLHGLFYKKYLAILEGFSDADGNTLLGDSLSTTGYIFTLGDGVVDIRFCTHDLIKDNDWNDHSYTPKIMIALYALTCSLHIIKMILRF